MATKTAAVDAKGYRKFGFRDVLAYGLGDFGCNMSFALKGTLTIFWTQYMGIDSILMASLLLLVQVWDAINDPVIGAMVDADKRQYKRNKFLAYIWAGSVGLLVAGALCFVPWTGAPYVVKCILFVAGYILWDAFYTVANVPYGSMLSLITADPVERAKLSTGRSVGSMVGSISASVILPMLIYDASNNLLGERIFIIALVMGILGFIAFQFMIRNTVVRVDTQVTLKEDAPKFNPLKATGHFLRNRLFSPDARLLGGRRAMIMSGQYDKVFPMDILPEYLLKAIIAKDIDRMEQLGIYEVAPEDFAAAEYVDTSKLELQKTVREGLDYLRKELS